MFKPQNLSNKLYAYASFITYDIENSIVVDETLIDIINCTNSQFKSNLISNKFIAN